MQRLALIVLSLIVVACAPSSTGSSPGTAAGSAADQVLFPLACPAALAAVQSAASTLTPDENWTPYHVTTAASDRLVLEAEGAGQGTRARTTVTCTQLSDPASGFAANITFASEGLSGPESAAVHTALLHALTSAR